jgi:hypothetical protein
MKITNLKLSVVRGSRAGRFHWEFHRHEGRGFIQVGIASPNHHRWWATTVYIYWKEV